MLRAKRGNGWLPVCSLFQKWVESWVLFLLVLEIAGCASVESASHADRMNALSKVQDEKRLFGYVLDPKMHEDVRTAAFERLSRSDLLYRLVEDERVDAALRMAALAKLRDENLLFRIAAEQKFQRTVREEAMNRIQDDDLLAQIALDASFPDSFKEKAIARMADDSNLLDVVQSVSLGEALRIHALRKLSEDETRAAALRTTGIPLEEKRTVLRKITDEDVLGGILVDSRVDAMLREEAAQCVSSEETLVSYAVDATVPEEGRNRAARRLYSPVACERALREGRLAEDIQFQLAEHVTDDAARVRLIATSSVALPVRCKLVRDIGNADVLAEMACSARFLETIRMTAAEALKQDERRLLEIFRKSRDLQGALLGIAGLSFKATANPEDQKRILRWFKATETSGRKDVIEQQAMLAERMKEDASLWYVAEIARRVSEPLRMQCIARVSNTQLLCRAAMRKGDSMRVRAAAIDALAKRGFDLHRLLRVQGDAMSRILVLQRLPRKEVQSDGVQRKLLDWFSQFGETKNEMDARACLIGLLSPEANVDDEVIQEKIAKTLLARDSETLRRQVRLLLVEPSVIAALVCEDYGSNPDVAEWAVDLIAGDAWIGRMMERTQNTKILCRLLSRVEREEVMAEVALGTAPAALRVVAIQHLGSQSAETLHRLAAGNEAGVVDAAIAALDHIDASAAAVFRKQREAQERQKKEQREAYLAGRQARDAKAHAQDENELVGKVDDALRGAYQNLHVRADVNTCKAWGRLQEKGTWVRNRDMRLPGVVTRVETHWFRADELWMDVELDGENYRVHARVEELNGAKDGSRVWVSGRFVHANEQSVDLKKCVVQLR